MQLQDLRCPVISDFDEVCNGNMIHKDTLKHMSGLPGRIVPYVYLELYKCDICGSEFCREWSWKRTENYTRLDNEV